MHIPENAGKLLKFAAGEPTLNLLRVAHPSLRVKLRTAPFPAAESNAPVQMFDLRAEIDGKLVAVQIRVEPTQVIAPGLFVIVFDMHEDTARHRDEPSDSPVASDLVVRHLERELEQKKELLGIP